MVVPELEIPSLPYGWKWDRHPPVNPSVTGRYKLTISVSRDSNRIYETFWVDVNNDTYENIGARFQLTLNTVALAARASSQDDTPEAKKEYICELLNQIQGEHV